MSAQGTRCVPRDGETSTPYASTTAATKPSELGVAYLDITALERQEEWERLVGGYPQTHAVRIGGSGTPQFAELR